CPRPVIAPGRPQVSTSPSTVPLTTTDPLVTETLPWTSPSTTTGPFQTDTLPRVTEPAGMCWPPLPAAAAGRAIRPRARAAMAPAAAGSTSQRPGRVCALATRDDKGGGRLAGL